MHSAAIDLTALLGSRICHDLISPIGAISNGVELMQMAGDAAGPEMDLISQSVANANARIRFFRVAFGAASPGQMIGATEINSILTDYSAGSRLRIGWQTPCDHARAEVRLVFLMLQCLETAMPWGGQITVAHKDARWSVSGTSDRMKIEPRLWQHLKGEQPDTDISAAEIQFLLFPAQLGPMGRTLQLDHCETGIDAVF